MSATLAQIAAISSRLVVYTDGSASGGTLEGGAGVVVTHGDPSDPEVLERITVKGAPRTSSYEEEVAAMNAALDWIGDNCDSSDEVTICTDSLSLCQALSARNEGTDETLRRIHHCKASIVIQWVPAHCGIPGNEAADQAAKDATKLDTACRPVSYASECARIRQAIQDPAPTDDGDIRIHEIYGTYNKARDEAEVTTRTDQVDLSRLRSRNHPAMRYYQHKLDETVDPTCPRCGDAAESIEHWLDECDAMQHKKMKTFGRTVLEKSILTLEPGLSLELARASILRDECQPLGPVRSESN